MAHSNQTDQRTPASTVVEPPLRPADEAAPGTPGTGENLCPRCSGTGRVTNPQHEEVPCPACEGSGKVVVGIGGA